MNETVTETLADLIDTLSDAEYGAPVTATYRGRTIRCSIEIDQNSNVFDDGDWYGQLADAEERWNDYPPPRPPGFDGRARKITTRDLSVWWQPPTDLPDEQLSAMGDAIRNLLEFGYSGVAVELLQGTDFYGAPIVVDAASLWGVDLANGDHRDTIADILSDLLHEMGVTETDHSLERNPS